MLSDPIADAIYMAEAIQLAKQGRFTTSPNPNVGCVIVKDGEVVGRGYHQYAGGPHAEVNALAQAGERANGATCYVTLEPCSHFGLTPPCADGLIRAKVGKVYAAMVDPNPLVAGNGLKKLQGAGIETHQGLLADQARALNVGFIQRMSQGKAWVRCKLASALDGKTALANGQSQWITNEHARADVQRLRAQSCAVISGADTVIQDNALLNVRYPQLPLAVQALINESQVRQPIRVIIDTQQRLTPELRLFSQPSPIILIRHQLEKQQQWPQFVEQVVVARDSRTGKADLAAVVAMLSQRGLNQLLLEAGPTLAGAFMARGLVDELIIYQAAKLMGDKASDLLKLPEYTSMDQVIQLSIKDLRMIGSDIRITAEPNNSSCLLE